MRRVIYLKAIIPYPIRVAAYPRRVTAPFPVDTLLVRRYTTGASIFIKAVLIKLG
jgi:hypothetical protein